MQIWSRLREIRGILCACRRLPRDRLHWVPRSPFSGRDPFGGPGTKVTHVRGPACNARDRRLGRSQHGPVPAAETPPRITPPFALPCAWHRVTGLAAAAANPVVVKPACPIPAPRTITTPEKTKIADKVGNLGIVVSWHSKAIQSLIFQFSYKTLSNSIYQ